MGIIRELPPAVINQIAAGEVIERPASVVKELLENAIDSGASRVELTVERGGKDLVRVADDGSGMDRDDLILAFKPHATSKLRNADELFRIATLGFRGEALAAIAEVSRVRCQTRRAEAEGGSELVVEAGVASEIKDCGSPVGTVLEVRNLFFNTPVRRTFLKSDSTESGHVAEMFTRIALAHPTVHLTMRSGGKLVYDLPPVTGLKERVAVFFGRELAESLLWVESQIDRFHLWGYVAHPSQSRSSVKGQYLFVGGRYVRDRSLSHALGEAYRGLLMVGRIPVAFLHLDIPPEEVDVNVHPTKVEVRFRDSQRLYTQMLSMIRQTFLASDLHSHLQAPPEARSSSSAVSSPPALASGLTPTPPYTLQASANDRQTVASWFSTDSSRAGTSNPTPLRTNTVPPAPSWAVNLPPRPEPVSGDFFDEFGGPGEGSKSPSVETESGSHAGSIGVNHDSPKADEVRTSPASSRDPIPEAHGPLRAIQVHDTYLIAETPSGMVVIDQHALHERILFEEIRARVSEHGLESQRMLVPEPVDLAPDEAALVLEKAEVLGRLGLEVQEFGGGTVLVTAVPSMLGNLSIASLLRDLAEQFRSHPLPPTSDQLLQDVMSMMACKAAVKANQRLTDEEINALLERRHLVSDVHHCPHGRPTALIFTKEELEKQFGRI